MKRSLTKAEILRRKADIRQVFVSGRPYTVKGMKLYVRIGEHQETRFLASPVRGYGTAVQRNYVRRISKELFRSHKDAILAGHDLALVLYPGDFVFAEREQQFLTLLRRAHLLT